MEKSSYQWAAGYRNRLDAGFVANVLDGILEKNDGSLTPDLVVQESEPDDAPLHPVFEWDDKAAAFSWRKQQARNMINHVEVVYIGADGVKREPIRCYASIRPAQQDDETTFASGDTEDAPQTNGRIYVAISRALTDAEMRNQLLDRAIMEIASWKRRYSQYQELAGLLGAIDQQLAMFDTA